MYMEELQKLRTQSKFTPERRAAVLESLRNGSSFEAAAASAGIAVRTLDYWRERGENAKSGAYFEFARDVQIARGSGIGYVENKLKTAIDNGESWAIKYFLDRLGGHEWKQLTTTHLTGGEDVGTNLAKTLAELQAKDIKESAELDGDTEEEE